CRSAACWPCRWSCSEASSRPRRRSPTSRSRSRGWRCSASPWCSSGAGGSCAPGRSVLEELRRAVTVCGALVRASLLTAMQYRSDFFLESLTGILRTLAALAPILLVFDQVDAVGGWDLPDMILVAGLYFFMHAVLASLVEPNLG